MSQGSPSAVKGSHRGNAVNTDVIEIELDSATRDALGEAMEKGVSTPYGGIDRALPEAVRIFHSLISDKFLGAIERFVLDPESLSAIRLSNLPIDTDLGPTPDDGMNVSAKRTFCSEGMLLGIGRVLGHPFAFREEKKGQLIHQICPVPKSAYALSNEGSLSDLGMHIENSFSEFRPHYLMLLCLRGDTEHKAMTRIASGRAIASRLSPEHLATAHRKEFLLQMPASFGSKDGKAAYSEPIAVLSGPPECEELRIDLPSYSKFLTDAATEAYEAIQAVLAEPGVVRELDMQPGQALILNNRKVTHGRTVFTPRYDGTDRWLQRMYTISDPWPMRALVDERLRVI